MFVLVVSPFDLANTRDDIADPTAGEGEDGGAIVLIAAMIVIVIELIARAIEVEINDVDERRNGPRTREQGIDVPEVAVGARGQAVSDSIPILVVIVVALLEIEVVATNTQEVALGSRDPIEVDVPGNPGDPSLGAAVQCP